MGGGQCKGCFSNWSGRASGVQREGLESKRRKIIKNCVSPINLCFLSSFSPLNT